MQYSGLFFITNPSTNLDAAVNTVNNLVQGIESTFSTITQESTWSLNYRGFRDTIPSSHHPITDAEGKPQPYAHAYQHLLNHSNLAPNRTFICIQPASGEGDAPVVSIPQQQQEAHLSMLRQQMAALWSPRHTISVQQGATYTGGVCTIRIAELRAIREGPQSGMTQSPGVVVCISTIIGGDESSDTAIEDRAPASDEEEDAVNFDYAQTLIRECWAMIREGRDIGRSEIREVMMASTLTTNKEREREAEVRMWCEVLRLRG